MGKIHDCQDCGNYMTWGHPSKITEKNYEYAKACLGAIESSFVCGQTNKTKPLGHKQQCRHFVEATDWQRKTRECDGPDVLRKMIQEFEEKEM